MNRNERIAYIEQYNGIKLSDIKRDILEVNKRISQDLWNDKIGSIIRGVEDIKEQYGDTYTQNALNETIADYKLSAANKAMNELQQEDNKVKTITTNTLSKARKREYELLKSIQPQSEFEMQQHQNMIDEISNKIDVRFLNEPIDTSSLNDLFDRAKYDDMFAKALLHTQGQVMNKVNDNQEFSEDKKHQLMHVYANQYSTLENAVLPNDYKAAQIMREEAEIQADYTGHANTFALMLNRL